MLESPYSSKFKLYPQNQLPLHSLQQILQSHPLLPNLYHNSPLSTSPYSTLALLPLISPFIIFNHQYKSNMELKMQLFNMTQVDTDSLFKLGADSHQRQQKQLDSQTQEQNIPQLDSLRNNLEHLTISEQDLNPKKNDAQNLQNKTQELEEEAFTRDLIDISKNSINFNKNTLFPGSIQQIDVSVSLKDILLLEDQSSGPFFLKIIATCHSSQFNDLDQYVYSVRSNQRFEYYDEVHFRIKKGDRADFKVAVKIPTCNQATMIDGTLSIQLQNAVPVFLPIISKCEIPKITCLKILEDLTGTQLIKIPAKKNTRLPPLPFKNVSGISCLFQVQTVTSEDMSQRAYDIGCPSSVICAANSPFFVMLQLKINPSYDGPIPKTDTIRKILILRVRNSSLYFSYPIEVYVYQSASGSNVN